MAARLRSPAALLAGLILAGIVGGTAVYIAGGRIDEADRARVERYERGTAPAITAVRARLEQAVRDPTPAAVSRARDALAVARGALREAGDSGIVEPVAEALATYLISVEAALTAAESRVADAPELLSVARARYREARDALIALRCRARVDDCERAWLAALAAPAR